MSETTLDIRTTPIKDILFELKKYHTEQLATIDSYLANSLNVKSQNNPTVNNIDTGNELLKFTKIWFWEKNAANFINEFFPKEKFTTRDLVLKAMNGNDFEKKFLAKVMYAASLSLGKLKKAGKIKAEKEDGLRGFKYYK